MRPIDDSDLADAERLLCEGFPQLPGPFWNGALARLKRYGGNAEAGVPLGFLLLDGSEPVGVMLTPASLHRRPDGRLQRVVNISSWYVRPAHRWRAGFMLRHVLADKNTLVTDLTPTPEVQKMLPLLGLQPLNRGVALHLLPLLCLHPASGVRLRPLAPDEPAPPAGPPRSMIEAHRELGCMPLVLEHAGGRSLVVCKRMRVRGVPAAQLIYAESRSLLLQHRGAVARGLLALGLLVFVHETRQARSSATRLFRPRDIWFARAAAGDDMGSDDRTDVFASELCIVHPWPDPLSEAGAAAQQPAGRAAVH